MLPTRPLHRLAALALTAALAALLLLAATAQARKATAIERPAMIAAWYDAIDIDDPVRCRNTWVTRVSAYRPRTGIIYANSLLREKRGCSIGDGYGVLRRPTRTSTAWRVVFQSSDVPPCRLITARMARELGLGFVCDPRG
ncbi:MAG: hypothetical protein JHC74_09915 [Thermoleophilia bacterium]|nr:hypothetical protein [Thermoleophilia bacterium]